MVSQQTLTLRFCFFYFSRRVGMGIEGDVNSVLVVAYKHETTQHVSLERIDGHTFVKYLCVIMACTFKSNCLNVSSCIWVMAMTKIYV